MLVGCTVRVSVLLESMYSHADTPHILRNQASPTQLLVSVQIFLPPLLLDAALKIDWYTFKKVSTLGPHSTFASQSHVT